MESSWNLVPRLTPFEIEAMPRIFDQRSCSQSESIDLGASAVKDIGQEMKCPICLELIENVMVTECLHRYCKDCIVRHLRLMGKKKECPICRVKIRTERSLRKDERMDALVALFFPGGRKIGGTNGTDAVFDRADISTAVKRHHQIVAEMKKRQKDIIERRNQDLRIQREQQRERDAAILKATSQVATNSIGGLSSGVDPGASNHKRSMDGENVITSKKKDYSVNFIILKNPGEAILQDAMIGEFRTNRNATVGHLKAFVKSVLSAKMGEISSTISVDIIVTLPGGENLHSCGGAAYRITDNLLSLGALSKLFDDRKLPPILTYGSQCIH